MDSSGQGRDAARAAEGGRRRVTARAAHRQTRGLFGYAEFGAMRPGAIYLNTSRGALHDLTALVDALRRGQVGGAGLDHFEGEWLDPSHPLIRLPNVVLTPRLDEATGETREELAEALVADIARLLRGENPEPAAAPA
nr:NAD(P)-dependent oxidoreductase [Nonomuraea polychroma]